MPQQQTARPHHSPVPSLTNHHSSRGSSTSSPEDHLATTPTDVVHRHYHKTPTTTTTVAAAEQQKHEGQKKRRREEGEDGNDDSEEQQPATIAQHKGKIQKTQQPSNNIASLCQHRKKKRLTGSVDFVKKYGLTDMYNEFVRPYATPISTATTTTMGGGRRPLPDLQSSGYMRDVSDTSIEDRDSHQNGRHRVNWMHLIMAPPKNEFERLEALPMATIRNAFAVGGKKTTQQPPRISLKQSDNSRKVSIISYLLLLFACAEKKGNNHTKIAFFLSHIFRHQFFCLGFSSNNL